MSRIRSAETLTPLELLHLVARVRRWRVALVADHGPPLELAFLDVRDADGDLLARCDVAGEPIASSALAILDALGEAGHFGSRPIR